MKPTTPRVETEINPDAIRGAEQQTADGGFVVGGIHQEQRKNL